ncbi:MAG TPA: HAD family hydrolase [Candidatus Binatia bacterium]|nr:HAD family hydrolase [Candidatus Binatia bacterium]
MSAAAFFDIDGTLLSVNTAPLYARYLRRHGRARRRDLVRTAYYLLQYRLNLLDIDRALERASRMIVGQLESDVAAFCERWYEDMVRAYLVPGMTRVMDEHRAAGHEIALLSSSTSYLAAPLARDLGVDHLLVTRLEIVDGRFTGRAVAPVCYGPGKVHWARSFARERGVALADSYFYTDSITDLPVLELVGHPRIVNPDRLLRRLARKRGWPILDHAEKLHGAA